MRRAANDRQQLARLEIGRRLCPGVRIIPLGANYGPEYARSLGISAATGARALFVGS